MQKATAKDFLARYCIGSSLRGGGAPHFKDITSAGPRCILWTTTGHGASGLDREQGRGQFLQESSLNRAGDPPKLGRLLWRRNFRARLLTECAIFLGLKC